MGQRRQTVFVVVLAVVLEETEKERTRPAKNAGAISAAMEVPKRCMAVPFPLLLILGFAAESTES